MFRKKRLISLILIVNLFLLCPTLGLSQNIFLPPEYITLVQQRIVSNIIYPIGLQDRHWEGVVKVRFTLMPDGQIRKLDIAQSSGNPLLDEAVMSAVRNASPYPSLGYYLGTKGIEIILPVNYGGLLKPTPTEERPFQEPPSTSPQEELILEPEFYTESEIQPGEKEIPPPQSEELEEFIELAVKNNQPTQIAGEEIDLAKLKIREANRNLFPAMKVQGYDTQGEVHNVAYDEKELKIELNQPIYYGGRLKDTLKQTKVNLEITKRNYDRLKIDVAHKAEVAYYNLVANRMNLKTQEALRQEAKKILQIVEKQFAADLVTTLELISTQSWCKQINFQIDSIKQDLAMARLTFTQVLNIPELPEITQQKLEIQKLKLDLNACLEAGLQNRPEIYLSGLLVKFNQYGKKIEDGKRRFTIDLTSSYSHYEGAWETESMQDSDNWYVGIKATRPWGASTITTSATTDETQPRYGETSATKTKTMSAELGFMDNLQRLSDRKESEIDLQRSLSDLNETTKTVNYEIKDAYLNYQKALLQATTAQSETEFRQREIEVLKVRAQVGEIALSSVMEALISLSRAQTTYTQALANYFISLANLKKAAGYGIKI